MTAPQISPNGPAEPDEVANTTLRKISWIAGLTALVVLMSAWVWAFFIYDPGLLIDELADKNFPTQAEQICAAAAAELAVLPAAETSPTPEERSAVIVEANGHLVTMTQELRQIAPNAQAVGESDSEAIGEWITDWDTHIGDRQRYAEGLLVDSEARFAETIKGQKQLSRAIDSYAQVNSMLSCETPGDVG